MRFALLLLIAAAACAADMRQLGPAEDLPFCRVVVNAAATIDKDPPIYETHDGWYCAATGHLYPLSDRGILLTPGPLNLATVVKVTAAGAAPGHMPALWRTDFNAYVAKRHPQVPDTDALAVKTAKPSTRAP